MIFMPRTRIFVLVLFLSLSILSYISFDAYIRPTFVRMPWNQEPFNPAAPSTQTTSPNDTIVTPNTAHSSILLVSAFFPLSKSKHPMHEYTSWLSTFLKHIKTPVYFFTTPDMEPIVRELRGDLPIVINTTYSSPFDIPPLDGMREKYQEMWQWDREKTRHSPELYAVWTAKPFFLDEGLRNAGAALPPSAPPYNYAFWTDAGAFRDTHAYSIWPDPVRVDEVWEEGAKTSGTRKEDLLFFPMWAPPHESMQFWGEGMGPVDNEFSEGSFFGGSPSTISWWRNLYFTYHNHYLSQGVFVGKDQTLINALFLLNPKRIISVWLFDPMPSDPPPNSLESVEHEQASKRLSRRDGKTPLGLCGSTWYYYQFFLASASEREAMTAIWGSFSPLKFWQWDWWTGKNRDGRCRLTRVIAMEQLLKRVFGQGWKAPGS